MIRNLRALPSPLSEKDGAPRRDPLRQLAAWYRAQAERAGSLWVWEARLQRAEDLEAQAAALVNSLPDHMLAPAGRRHEARSRRDADRRIPQLPWNCE